MATPIDGKRISEEILAQVAEDAAALTARGCRPGLAMVLVGADPASQVYVRSKRRACRRAGIESFAHDLPADTPQEELLALLDRLGADPAVHGILVQLPLPPGFDTDAVIDRVPPEKDVDGVHPRSAGLLTLGRPGFVPCTPAGILRLLDRHGVPLEGRRAVVVGRSALVGKPVAALLLQRNATVTVCHSRTADLPARVAEADVVVAAIGRPRLIGGDWIRPGAVVVDVGINRVDDGEGGTRLVGDVAYEEAAARAALITPVPGGVGPMTIAMLLENTVRAARSVLEARAGV
jgi:methylenetetrahydrofolate dehydrogenase (NADP+)/methenyltetrahydrofolate cyclohydrolase